MKFIKKHLLIIIILIAASVLRLLWLGQVPNAIGGDELVYIVTAKSIFLNFSDITGFWNPLSAFIFHYPSGEMQAELPYFILAPFVGYAPFSLFTSRFIYAILSILSILFIYLISKEIFNKNTAIFAGFLSAINPWFIYLGRTSYEMVPALFFYLLSLYILIIAKSWKILVSIPFLFFAFYSYIGTKLIFFPFVLVVLAYCYFILSKKKYLKQYIIVGLASLTLVLFFVFQLKTSSAPNRTSEILLPNNPQITREVDLLRKASIQAPFLTSFDNKLTVYGEALLTKAFNSLSFNYLFIKGDSFYNLGTGFFYFIDAVFLIIGFCLVAVKRKKEAVVLTCLLIIGLLPEMLHVSKSGDIMENFSPHLTLIFPILVIFMAYGLSESLSYWKNKKIKFSYLGIVVVVYLFFLLSFIHLYFYQFPLRGNFDFHVRLMSAYSKQASKDSKVIVYSSKFRDEFKKYIFYADILNKSSFNQIKEAIKGDSIVFGNVEFTACDNTINPENINKTIVYDYVCGALKKDYKHLDIPRLEDGGESYRIYNDSFCSRYSLKSFPSGFEISDFDIEKMSSSQFCQTYITDFK